MHLILILFILPVSLCDSNNFEIPSQDLTHLDSHVAIDVQDQVESHFNQRCFDNPNIHPKILQQIQQLQYGQCRDPLAVYKVLSTIDTIRYYRCGFTVNLKDLVFNS